MTCAGARFYYVIPIIAALCGAARSQGVYSTTVTPAADEDILGRCQYELTLPRADVPIRAVWVIFDRGPEVLHLYNDADVFRFAEKQRLALLLPRHCRSKEREDIDVQPDRGIGRALFTALEQLAQISRHGELTSAKLIVFGFSGAGSLAGRFPGFAPDRVLASIGYAPGQYEPLGMDTIQLSPAAIAVPQLIVANGADAINGTERPFDYFRKHFGRGAPWAFAIQNGVPHHGGLANAKPLMFAWLEGILDAPPAETGITAFAVQRSGWWLYLRTAPTQVQDEWDKAVYEVREARIDKVGSPMPANYVAAGWAPTRKAANEWLTFVKKPAHPVDTKYR
jgi:dienelactone hydrolase